MAWKPLLYRAVARIHQPLRPARGATALEYAMVVIFVASITSVWPKQWFAVPKNLYLFLRNSCLPPAP